MAIEGSVRVPGLHDQSTLAAVGGLGLAAASVSIAYYACGVVLIAHRWRGF